MKVHMFGTLRSIVGGNKEVEVRLTEQSTVQEALAQLVRPYPDLERKVFSAPDQISAGVQVFVNGRSILFLDGLDTRLHEDDRLALFPPLAGG